jgi:hypothetical protein
LRGCWDEHAEALAAGGVGEAKVEGHERQAHRLVARGLDAGGELEGISRAEGVNPEKPAGRPPQSLARLHLDPFIGQPGKPLERSLDVGSRDRAGPFVPGDR